MFYTREQCQKLEKYRRNFETAINQGYARNVGSIALKEIEQVYDEALKKHYSYNNACSICVLSFLKRVGTPFLADSKAYAEEDARKQAEELAMQENKQEDLQPEKPKRTRKKKENIENGTE